MKHSNETFVGEPVVPMVAESADAVIELDSIEAIRQFYDDTVATFRSNLQEQHPGVVIDEGAVSEHFQGLRKVLRVIEQKLADGEELADFDAETIQSAYEAALDAEFCVTEPETFDPNAYIAEQFAQHPYLIPSQRTPVYLLQREYKRAVTEGATEDAEILAQQIKDYVDELVGDEAVEEEEYLAPLPTRASRQLVPTQLDDDSKQVVTITQKLTPVEQLRDDLAKFEVAELEPDVSQEAWQQAELVGEPVSSESADETQSEKYTEAELTSHLYGMQVPTSQSENYAIASFREGIKVAMYHDPKLAELPGKQELFDELVTLLDYVPDGGLSEEIERELVSLVRKINDPKFAVQESEDISQVVDQTTESPLVLEQSQRVYPEVTQSISFTPQSVSNIDVHPTAQGKEKLSQKDILKQVQAIESEGADWLGRTFGVGPSLYTACKGELFTELMGDAGAWNINQILQQYSVDRNVYDQWYLRRDEIMDTVEDVEGKTFKEVVDEYLAIRRETY